MSLDKIVKKNNTRFLVVLLLFSSFFTGTIIISTTALNVSSRTSGSSQVTESSSPSLYPFPKSPHPASTLYFTGVGGPGTPLGFTVAALQGIVARTQPQIFLTTNPEDHAWLGYLVNTYGITAIGRTPPQILQQFKNYVTDSNGDVKIIVYDSNDPMFPMQVNMATTLAGVYTALPVSSNDLSTIQSLFGSKINILYDLRGQFSTKVAGYSWLWNLVGSQVTRQFVAMAPEGRIPLTDYIVEFKAFDFEICCPSAGQHYTLNSTEQNFVNQIFSNYAPLTPVIGFFGLGGEVNTINYLSQHGFSATAGDGVADLSVYSGFPDAIGLSQVPEKNISYDSSKVYVLWEITQGDALQYDFYNNYAEWTAVDPATNQPYRNEVPVTWQINPIMAELAPPIIQGWYATQSPLDDFITGPSGGAGYDHPDYMPDEAQQLALATNLDANAGIGIHFDIFQSLSTSTYQKYINYTHPSAILLWQNSGRAPQIVNGVPVMTSSFWESAGTTFTSADVSNTLSQIQGSGKFVYVIMNAQNPGLPFIQEVMNKLGSNYVAVSASQYTNLYLQSKGITTTSTSSYSSTTQSSTSHSKSTSDTSQTSSTSSTTSETTSENTSTTSTSSTESYTTHATTTIVFYETSNTSSTESDNVTATSSTGTQPETSQTGDTTQSLTNSVSSSNGDTTISTSTSQGTQPAITSSTHSGLVTRISTSSRSSIDQTTSSTASSNQIGDRILSGAVGGPTTQQSAAVALGTFAAFGVYFAGRIPMNALLNRKQKDGERSRSWRW